MKKMLGSYFYPIRKLLISKSKISLILLGLFKLLLIIKASEELFVDLRQLWNFNLSIVWIMYYLILMTFIEMGFAALVSKDIVLFISRKCNFRIKRERTLKIFIDKWFEVEFFRRLIRLGKELISDILLKRVVFEGTLIIRVRDVLAITESFLVSLHRQTI
jgi:hypothetical protein